MKRLSFYKLLLVTVVFITAFSSCTTYKESMVKTTYQPIQQKIPDMQVDVKANCNIASLDLSIIENTVKEEINSNILSPNISSNGKIEVVCDKYILTQNLAVSFLSGLSLFTLNFVGYPISMVAFDMRLKFNIYDKSHNLIKDYSYDVTDKSAMGFYYGRGARVVLVDVTKKALVKFRKDVENDAKYITERLNNPGAPQNPNNDYMHIQQPVMAQQQVQQSDSNQPIQTVGNKTIQSDVDVNIPITNRKAGDTFVLIIANEHYTFVDNVDFAIHDGEVFKEYCIKTLGVPERQVWFYKDASAGIISGGVDKMVQAMSLFENSKAIVYYCGHGIPDEHTGDAYIVPTDGKGTNTATCYSLNKMYTTLAASNAVSVTYFMDACFSGANKEGSMLVAARGVAREAKKETLNGNTVVFSAASGDETAMTYKEKGHGLFTYFLLKKLQETNGDVSYGDLDKYIKDNVKRESFLTNEKLQHPATNVSENAAETWKDMRLK